MKELKVFSAIIVAVLVPLAWGAHLDAGCTLVADTCYQVVPGCPTQYNCTQVGNNWLTVTMSLTRYVCMASELGTDDCDIDQNNRNNKCGTGVSYANQADCLAKVNGTAVAFFSAALCAGSNPCGG